MINETPWSRYVWFSDYQKKRLGRCNIELFEAAWLVQVQHLMHDYITWKEIVLKIVNL
jgi:hypothetical protein